MNNIWTKSKPYIATIVLFVVISSAYFPLTYSGKQVEQHDKKTWQGMSKEVKDFKEDTGETSLWTNSMFGGMPTYLINNYIPSNYIKYVNNFLQFNQSFRPISFLLLYFFGFYIALLAFKFNNWLSLIGALAFGLSSYFLIIIQAGHITKAVAIGYMPPIIAGVYLAYSGKRVLGTVLMSLFLGLQLLNNHLQITYYTLIIVLPLVVVLFINDIKEKRTKAFFKSSLFLAIGLFLVIGANFETLITTYDYSKYTTRSQSELSFDKENKTSGLDRDYATSWSYGKMETFNLLIPDLFGGASGGELSTESETYKELINVGAPKSQARDIIKRLPLYWGPQPMTSGPVYIGALVIFLFVMGMFLVRGPIRTWLIIITVLSITLAWGRNFMFLTDFFFDYIPGYNKFRTVSMTLVIAEFAIPLLGLFALKDIISKKVSKKEVISALKYSTGILAAIILIFLINPGILSFTGASDSQLPEYLQKTIPVDRESIMQTDALRSLVFILMGAVLIWLYVSEKLGVKYLYISLAVLILIDLWSVDKRYMNDGHFVSKRAAENPFSPTVADNAILADNSLDYRVLNLSLSTFNDASTSYFHKSIGGYHGAKMKRYQELINYSITPEMSVIITVLQNNPTEQSINDGLQKTQILNMLNTKYIIANPDMNAIPNIYANGNVWFVNDVKVVKNADEEIMALKDFNSKNTAIVDKRYEDLLFDFNKDSLASIQLIDYKPNKLVYSSSALTNQLAVFSEIYYDKGWNAYIDGKKVPYFRANYILRAMQIPKGKHEIVFKFEPQVVFYGIISKISSILIILIVLATIYLELTNNKLIRKIE